MIEKFKVAFIGLLSAFNDKSVLIQIVLGTLVLIVSFILKLEKIDFIVILICISCVITTEILNTAIEEICDMYTTSHNEKIKYIKDLSAGAVLFVSIVALVIGLIIFIPYIRRII